MNLLIGCYSSHLRVTGCMESNDLGKLHKVSIERKITHFVDFLSCERRGDLLDEAQLRCTLSLRRENLNVMVAKEKK